MMNQGTKLISFSSPKGGVGRTMTLANCAKIYSEGSEWAGLEKVTTLLVDFDFHAPGIQYYDFLDGGKEKKYQINGKTFSSFTELQAELNENEIGIAFLFDALINHPEYQRICDYSIKKMKINEDEGLEYFQQNVMDLFDEKAFDPANHIISFEQKSLFVLPAGSPYMTEYNDIVFGFQWLNFINNYLGIYLVDCILFYLINKFKTKSGIENKPVRILLDQQAGISVSADLNRSLANAHVLVGGFNEQNKAGLKALVDNYYRAYDEYPWIVLNQYNFRKVPLDYTVIDMAETPHDKFKGLDKLHRKDFIEDLLPDKSNFPNVFVTDFVDDAIQKEHFHYENALPANELIKLIVSLEKSFVDELPSNKSSDLIIEKIVYLGEKVENDNVYSGPFNALHPLMSKHHKKATVIGLAATHEDIVFLCEKGDASFKLFKAGNRIANIEKKHLGGLSEGQYTITIDSEGDFNFKIQDFDYISYPYHSLQDLLKNNLIVSSNPDKFFQNIHVADSLNGFTPEYCRQNIFRWDQYCVDEKNSTVYGVPLFFDFQLIAYRKDYFTQKQRLTDEYRHVFHRKFAGFNDPDDILKFAELTKEEEEFKSVLLCGNCKNIAMWYEWQTIFSIFYYQNNAQMPRLTSLEDYKKFLLSEVSLDATLMYLQLRKLTDSTKSSATQGSLDTPTEAEMATKPNDWDWLNKQFFLSKLSSLIFIWPDAIPANKREDSDFIYQVPPSFHVFEECWMLSAVNKTQTDTALKEKIVFLNKYLTPEYQITYVEKGGLPVHKDILASLDLWYLYPFLPPIWSIYHNHDADDILNKRDCFEGIFEAGKQIADILDAAHRSPEITQGDDKKVREQLQEFFVARLATFNDAGK